MPARTRAGACGSTPSHCSRCSVPRSLSAAASDIVNAGSSHSGLTPNRPPATTPAAPTPNSNGNTHSDADTSDDTLMTMRAREGNRLSQHRDDAGLQFVPLIAVTAADDLEA